MLGAIVGDIVGSSFEIENQRSIYFELFRSNARFTDDTVCTTAIADILMTNKERIFSYIEAKKNNALDSWSQKDFYGQQTFLNHQDLSNQLRLWCLQFLNRGFGSIFQQWILNGVNMPYNSYGNGAIMKISPVAYFAHQNKITKKDAIQIALDITNITHNHAIAHRAVAAYIDILMTLLAHQEIFRNHQIKVKNDDLTIEQDKNLENNHLLASFFYYKLVQYGLIEESQDDDDFCISQNIMTQYPLLFDADLGDKDIWVHRLKRPNQIKISQEFNLRADDSLKIVLASILEASDFEEGLRVTVLCGGDTDTYCAIAGPILESLYGISEDIKNVAKTYFKKHDLQILKTMESFYQ